MKDYSRINNSVSRTYRRRRKQRGGLYLKVVTILALLMAVWLVASPYSIVRLHQLTSERKELLVASSQLEETNALLRQNIERFNNDPKFRERMVRRELGWLKDGERIYRFVDH